MDPFWNGVACGVATTLAVIVFLAFGTMWFFAYLFDRMDARDSRYDDDPER